MFLFPLWPDPNGSSTIRQPEKGKRGILTAMLNRVQPDGKEVGQSGTIGDCPALNRTPKEEGKSHATTKRDQ